MALDDILRDAVALVNQVTQPLQATVQHASWTAGTWEGGATLGSPVARKAIVDWKQKQVRTLAGELTVSRAYIAFLEPVIVDEKDVITLPDGTTGPILDMSGFIDPDTGRGYITEVWLG